LIGLWRIVTATTDVSTWLGFSPLGAMALFGGAYFSKRYQSYLFPILILLVSDLILMNTMYSQYASGWLYDGWYWTYGSFALMVALGTLMRNRITIKNFFFTGISAGLIHFILSNFGVWLGGGIDPVTGQLFTRDLSGVLACYAAGIPYFKTLVMGNLFFGVIFFGGFEWAQRKIKVLQIATPL
jgi:hypothetical protein